MISSVTSRHAIFAILLALVIRWGSMSSPPFGEAISQDFLSFTFFMHDNLLTATDTSAFGIVAPLQVPTFTVNDSYFGAVVVFDDSITVDPDPGSLEIGRGRGIYVFDANDSLGGGIEFLWTAEFNAASGYGDGIPLSTLTFKGFDRTVATVREIAIVGGTGKFRLARGWAVVTTYSLIGIGAANLNITANVFYGFG